MQSVKTISLTDIIMRIFERLVYKQEIFATLQSSIGPNQFACQEGHNATVVLLKCQHYWLNWVDKGADFVLIFALNVKTNFLSYFPVGLDGKIDL